MIFEIDTPPQAYRGLAGVDYLRLGLIRLRRRRLLCEAAPSSYARSVFPLLAGLRETAAQ